MMTDHNHPAVLAPVLASWAAVLAVATGDMVLLGWAFDIAALKSVLPGWVSMKVNTAVCFILTGIALLLTARSPATFNPRLSTFIFRFARLCVLLVGLIGLLTLGEYVFGWNPGLDQWLFHDPAGAVGTSDPGRMAPETALCFVLLAAALWLTGGSRKTRWTILASGSFGLLIIALSLASMLSYLTPGLGSYGWFGLTIMAMHTSLLLAMLGMAVIAICWRYDVLPWSLGRITTAAFACGMTLLVLIGFNTNRSQFRLAELDLKITHSVEVHDNIWSILIEVVNAQAHIRGYVITGDEHFKAHYLETKASGNAKLDALRKFVVDDLHQQQQLARIEEQVKAQFEWHQQIIDANRTGMSVATRNNMISHGEDLLGRLRITFGQVENEQHQFILELKQELESVFWFSYLIISAGTLASLLIFLTVIFRLNFAVNELNQTEDTLRVSRKNLHLLLNSIVEGAYGLDTNGNCTFVNRAFLQMLGYRNDSEVLGKHVHELIHHSHGDGSPYPANECRTDDAYRLSKSINVSDEVFWRKDGVAIPVEYWAQPIVSDSVVIGAIVTFIDITERKKTEAALREKELLLSESQRIAHIGSWRLDLPDQLSWSDETYRIYGVSRDTFTPSVESLLNLIHPDDRLAMQASIGACVADKKPGPLEFRITLSDGTVRIHKGYSELQYGAGNRPNHLIGVVHDITERKQAETRLAEQLVELRRWHDVTSGREGRILDLKHEVNELLSQAGQPLRYPSAAYQDPIEG